MELIMLTESLKRKVTSWLVIFCVFQNVAIATQGPADPNQSEICMDVLPPTQEALEHCLEYKESADKQILNLKDLVNARSAFEGQLDAQRSEAFSRAEKAEAPKVPWYVPSGIGLGVGVVLVIFIRGLGKK